ncbi:UNVERIFIED_CONTAM: hypothetical protein FKN15_057980 [Acipenser sinensis]
MSVWNIEDEYIYNIPSNIMYQLTVVLDSLGSSDWLKFGVSQVHFLLLGNSSNVLLDSVLVPKLSDFGLARFSRSSASPGRTTTVARTRTLRGTLAYLPQEYLKTGRLSLEIDTYSFGVVLLEMLTGRRAMEGDSNSKTRYLKDLASEPEEDEEEEEGSRELSPEERTRRTAERICQQHLDRSAGVCPPALTLDLCTLACRCLERRPKKRPKMTEVRFVRGTRPSLGLTDNVKGQADQRLCSNAFIGVIETRRE